MTAPPGDAGGVVLVEMVRNGFVESVHRGHVVILDATGATVLELGRPREAIFPRSSNKPLQAVGMLDAGLRVDDEQLALAASSHSGEPRHLQVVRSTLAAAGLTEADLRCPADLPLGEPARADVLAAGERARPIYMNCSGKHAAMLKACRDRDWSITDYLDPEHPLQSVLTAAVEGLAGETVAATGVDGCGAPVFAISLVGLARAFATLAATTTAATTTAGAADGHTRRVAQAMRRHPDLVGGTNRPVTRLLRALPGLVAKDGAEGVWAAALPGVGAVAVKIDDGATRAADRVVAGALLSLGARDDVLTELAEEPVLGGGRPVGAIRLRAGVLELAQ